VITAAVVRVSADAYSTGVTEDKNGYKFLNYKFNTAITRSSSATVTVRLARFIDSVITRTLYSKNSERYGFEITRNCDGPPRAL
jgi:hypothetical protein